MVTFNIISDAAPVTDKDQQIGEPNKVTDNLLFGIKHYTSQDVPKYGRVVQSAVQGIGSATVPTFQQP